MKFLPHRLIAATASATALVLAAGFVPAHAQTEEAPAAADVDDQTLQAFAQASLAVEEVINDWSERIEQTEDADEQQEMRTEANEEIATAVEANGLEIETYNEVYQLAQSDPDVATQIQNYRQDMQ